MYVVMQEAVVADLQETLRQTEEAVQAVQVSTTSYTEAHEVFLLH